MKYRLQDLIDIEQFQTLQDRLNEICAFPSLIIDKEGKILTATAWQDICAKYHRQNTESGQECVQNDQNLLRRIAEGGITVGNRCPHGLMDCALPIIVDGEQLGTFFTGQFLPEEPDMDFFREQARRFGFDEESYLGALKKVPVWTPEKRDSHLLFIKGLIEIISDMGLKTLRAMEAHQESSVREKQFQAVFDTASIGIAQADPQTGRWMRVNQKMCDITGYTAGELLSMRVPEITHPDDSGRDWEAFQRVIRGEAPNYRMEKRYIRKDGEYVWVNVNMTVIRDDAGQPVLSVAAVEDITERKTAEEALATNQRLLENITDNSTALIYALDLEGKFLLVNRRFESVFGVPRDAMIGKAREAFMSPDIVAAHRNNDLLVMKGRHPVTLEEENNQKDGIHAYLSVKFPLFDAAGKAYGIGGVSTDITERNRAEAKARRLTQLYAALSECNQAILHSASEEGLFPQVCRDAVVFGGMKMAWVGLVEEGSQQVIPVACYGEGTEGLKTIQVSTDADSPYGRGPIGISIRENRPFWCQDIKNEPAAARWHEHGGRFGWIALASLPLRREGNPVGSFTLYSDTAQAFDEDMRNLLLEMAADINFALDKFAAEAKHRLVEERNRQLAAIVHHSDDAIIGKNMEGIITSWNRGAERIYGYTEGETVGNPISMLVPAGRHDEVPDFLARIARGEHVDHFETVRKRKDGTLIDVSVTISPVRNAENKIIGASSTAHDITGRKRAEAEQAKLETQLQQAQKLESVGRLAGGVAHDFNNMLAVILGHVEIALDESDPLSQLHGDLEEIRKAAVRSADLTRQLLTFARKQTVAPKVLDPNETVSGVLKMLQRLIGEDIHLEWHPSPNAWKVKIDPSQIDQILANLCVNARDAITDVGKITIETANRLFDDQYCSLHIGFAPGEYVMLAVSDDGCGMDKDTLARIFEPFYTTKGVGEGTGLGLATVYGAVRQNNGFINVYSEPGAGTTFTIYLPRYAGEIGDAPSRDISIPAPRGDETILLVEDEPAVLVLTKRLLEAQGYTVLAAHDASEAIHIAEQCSGKIHLLITDLIMPDMNGRVLAEHLLLRHSIIRHLFMSGYTADVIAHHGVLEAGVHFIQKPFSAADLAKRVRETLDGG